MSRVLGTVEWWDVRGVITPQQQAEGYLDGIAEREVGRELQVAQAHACDWAGPVALGQPALDAHAIIGVPCRHHDWIRHELLQQGQEIAR